jgi:hypothetical protein
MATQAALEVYKLLLTDNNIKPAVICETLAAQQVLISEATANTYRTHFLSSLSALRKLGMINESATLADAPVKLPAAEPKPKKPKAPSRASRWAAACGQAEEALSNLKDLQEGYEEWKDSLPENLQSSAVGEKLEEVCGLDINSAIELIGECEGIDLPLGFGRD